MFDGGEVERERQRPVKDDMADPPTEEELLAAVAKLKSGKAAGKSGILPEMVKVACCDGGFVRMLLELVREV